MLDALAPSEGIVRQGGPITPWKLEARL